MFACPRICNHLCSFSLNLIFRASFAIRRASLSSNRASCFLHCPIGRTDQGIKILLPGSSSIICWELRITSGVYCLSVSQISQFRFVILRYRIPRINKKQIPLLFLCIFQLSVTGPPGCPAAPMTYPAKLQFNRLTVQPPVLLSLRFRGEDHPSAQNQDQYGPNDNCRQSDAVLSESSPSLTAPSLACSVSLLFSV